MNLGQGVEHRRGFLHALVEQGHDVTLGSTVRKKEQVLLKSRSLSGKTSWYNKLKYDIYAKGTDFDVLILECGSNNVRYTRGTSEGPEVNILGLNVQRLREFRGKVFLWHHIYATSVIFPFGTIYNADGTRREAEGRKPVEELSDSNWRFLFDKFDPFEGKEWTILHHCLDEEAFKRVPGRYKLTYGDVKQFKYKYVHLPISTLDDFIPTVKPKPDWDSLYIGSGHSHAIAYSLYKRFENVKKFYDTPLYKTGVLGKFGGWEGDGDESFKYATNWNDGGSNIPIAVQNWNNSYTHIFTDSPACLETGSITGRTFLSLQGGSILLLDKNISNVHKLNLGAYEVADAKEASEWIKVIKDWSPQKRDEIRRQQLSTFPVWENIPWEEILTGKKDSFDFSDSKLNVGSYTPIPHQRNNDYA